MAIHRVAAGRRETLLFTVATVVLALHAALDAFIAPEPGTSRNDHIGRGAATLAILTAAALAYPRLRAGARAGLAAFFGALGGEGAVLAILDSRATGPRGEDWTGSCSPRSVLRSACAPNA